MSKDEQLRLLSDAAEQLAGYLPSGWIMARVDDLSAVGVRAITDGPFGSNLKSSHYTDDGPRVIRLQNIGGGLFHDARAHISFEHFERLRSHEALPRDLIVAMLGETLPKACMVPATLGPAIVKADCARVRIAEPDIAAPFVMHALNSPQTRAQAADLIHGVGRPRLGLGLLREMFVPLAPMAEQRQIVDALDSYFSRLDDAVATLERVQRNLKRYRASVLKAAVEGRLVPTEAELARQEGRDYEPADVLLQRILEERKARWIEDAAEKARARAESKAKKAGKRWSKTDDQAALEKGRKGAATKYEEPEPPDTSELPELPEGWCWTTTETLYWSAGYGTSQKCSYEADGPPVLRIPNVDRGAVDLGDLKYATSDRGLKDDGVVEPGDFLFIRTNGSRNLIGRGAPVVVPLDTACHFASYLIRLRLVMPGILPAWMGLAWHSETVRSQILRDAASSAGQHNVSLGAARTYAIPLPPVAEAERIRSEVARCWSVSDAAQADVERNLLRLARLRQSILKWAFEGRLVDQDPSDEPASVLLERIAAEREKAEANGGKKKRRTKSRKKKTA